MAMHEQARRVGEQAREYLLTDGEGGFTKMIESQTSRIPSGTYLSLGILAMLGSLVLMIGGRRNLANFVGQWVPTLLIIGLYNKLVKVEGSE